MAWWIWILVAFAFFVLEALTAGTLVVGFFGLGALAVGFLVLMGIGGPAWVQFLLFTVISLAALAVFRQPLVRRLRGETDEPSDVDSLVGETGMALSDMSPAATGRVELRGTAWSARNTGTEPIGAGDRVVVAAVRGLTLDVRREV